MAETMGGSEAHFFRWKAVFERKGLKVNLGKKNVIKKGGGSGVVVLAKIDSCGVCGMRARCARVESFL